MASLLQQGGVPSADSDLRTAATNASSSSSSSSSKINISLQESKFNIVFNIIYHIHGLLNIIIASEPLDMVGSELERQAFADLKAVISAYKQPNSSYFQLLEAFLRTLSTLSSKSYIEMVNLDIVQAWDKTIQVMTVVMPPFHDIFLGHIPQVNDMPSGWLYVIPHYVQALFSDQFKCLDDVLKSCLEKARSDYETDAECNENMSNAIIIQRSPEILAISCESTLLPENLRRQTISSTTTNPSSIEFPLVLDLSVYQMSSSDPEDDDEDEDDDDDDEDGSDSSGHRYYDLVAVISLDTPSYSKYSNCLRLSDIGRVGHYGDSWSRSIDDRDVISSNVAVEGSYYHASSSSSVPRFLLYVKRGLSELLNRLQPFVSKAGQCRAMGDMTYALATTIDSYKEARRYYEEAISYDPSYREMLKDTLQSLDKIDSIQHSRGLEEQGDISLVNHRLKESCESYAQASASLVGLSAATSSTMASTSSAASSSSSSAMSSSLIGLTSLAGLTASYDDRLKEKLNLVKQMQSLEIVVHCVEKGEEALKDCKYAIAKDYYTKAAKLNSNAIFSNHFSMISSYVDKTMQTLVAIQKIDDAHLAMKDGKYRLANQLFSEAIILVPDKASGLQGILDGFTPLIQCEDALIQQRAGLTAFEERNYEHAKNLLTEAINLLPSERSTDLAIFYADRAMAWQELHEYEKALDDCSQSIALKNDYAIAYLRKGAALFSLGRYTDAITAYDKAEGFDPSLSSQVQNIYPADL
jgi:tetratricopeptide (TPR) repeat protein